MVPTTDPCEPRRSWALRRFVAYSIGAHIGAACAWGVPALMDQAAEHERIRDVANLAEHFRKEGVKTKEHVRQQRIDATRKEVEQSLRAEFDNLTATLEEKHRDDLWQQVAEKNRPQADDFSEALGEVDVPEQNLRTLEAALRKAMIENLNEVLTAESARDLAEQFLDRVENQVAPALASALQAELSARLERPMRDEARALVAAQRKAAQVDSNQALASLRSASQETNKASQVAKRALDSIAASESAASTTAGSKSDENRSSASHPIKSEDENSPLSGPVRDRVSKGLAQAAQRLAAAGTALESAASTALGLDQDTRDHIHAAGQAIQSAQEAVSKAAVSVQGDSDTTGILMTEAAAAITAAQTASQTAMAALGDSAETRAALVGEAIRATAESTLRAQIEKDLRDEIIATTLPRLAGKLQESFAEELSSHGLRDEAVVSEVGRAVMARLAEVAPRVASSAQTVVSKGVAELPAGSENNSSVSLGDSALDRALAAGLANMATQATKRVGELAALDAVDVGLIKQSRPSPRGQVAAHSANDSAATAALRETIGSLARSINNGRLGSAGASELGISNLREAALGRNSSRGGHSGLSPMKNESLYSEVAGQVAGRESVHGEAWLRQGVEGETSRAENDTGDLPATVVGDPLGLSPMHKANDQPYVPQFKTIAFTAVPYAAGVFAIDGNLAKWEAVPNMKLTAEHGDFPAQQTLKMMWSQAGLFVYCQIADPNNKMDRSEVKTFWESDCVEIWIDAYNTKESFRARHIGQQFWIWPAGSSSDPSLTGGEAVAESKGGSMRMRELRADQLERWSQTTPEGWVMEARIPAALITDADLAAGRIIGFNAYVNTMGGTDWYWSAGDAVSTSVQPDTWGDLLLAGSDATIEVLAGEDDHKARVLRVGEPLRLRVSDGDMDLDPRTRDKVMVTVKGGPGGQQMAVLEETDVSTGIFEGAVTTALALDEAVPAVLGVYEGERVEIIYMDQARSNGAREARLSTTATFGSAVMVMSNLATGLHP